MIIMKSCLTLQLESYKDYLRAKLAMNVALASFYGKACFRRAKITQYW